MSISKIFFVIEKSITLAGQIYKLFKKQENTSKPVNQLTFNNVTDIQNQIRKGVEKSRELNSLNKKDR